MTNHTEKAKQWLDNVKTNEDYDPLVTYYFINKNLQMSPGKIGVQTARAGQVMMLSEYDRSDSLLFESLKELFEDDFMHGNKSICLKANENQMNRIINGELYDELMKLNETIRLYPVYDIGATEVEPNSLTVIGMTPVHKSTVQHITKKFQLYK